MKGASDGAHTAIAALLKAGVHTAVQAVVTAALVREGRLGAFIEYCGGLAVHDVMLLEEVTPSGDSAKSDRTVTRALKEAHIASARDAARPKVSSMCFLESPEYLGCQAGCGFAYVSAAGEVFPCDFAPTSFGNVYEIGLAEALDRMSRVFAAPRRACLARALRPVFEQSHRLPLTWDQTREVFARYRPGPPPRLAF